MARGSVFVSYSHADEKWLARLKVHLRPLEREGKLTLWADTAIKPGQEWKKEIARALKTAKVAVLLVSAVFLASDFIAEHELPPLLAAAQKKGAVILPLILSACRFEKTEGLKDFQAVNLPSKPIVGMTEAAREEMFVDLVGRIEEVLDDHAKKDEALEEEDVALKEDDVFHPGRLSGLRSTPVPCRFFVSPFYRRTHLWSLYGDVQVELREHTKDPVFLIPSGKVAPHLRDTAYLSKKEGRETVRMKQDAADAFVEQWKNQELRGFKFTTRTKSGDMRTKVYCAAYDKCLTAAVNETEDASDA